MNKKIILISVVGTSPAVLTETVWALATGEQSVVPDEVVVLTTLTGKRKLQEQILGGGNLLSNNGMPLDGGGRERKLQEQILGGQEQILGGENTVWSRMCGALKKKGIDVDGKLNFGSSGSIQVFSMGSNDLNDITTPEENMAAADFILRTIRGYSEDPSTQIFASVAGGRKTMSALMLSCMSLLARADDHVLHVLVNEPFDGAVEPAFYFPDSGKYVVRRTQEPIPVSRATIVLIDLPFVKVRALYEGRFGERVPSYVELVKDTQNSVAMTHPLIKLDFVKGNAFFDDEPLKLSATEMVALGILLCKRPNSMKALQKQMCDLRKCKLKESDDWSQSWLEKFAEGSRFTNDESDSEGPDYIADSSKVLSSLRKKTARDKSDGSVCQ